jgi:hypothetical protein
MGHFTSIFRHPVNGVYRYSFGAVSLEEERKTAELMGAMSNEIFGDFLYARPVRQVLPRCGQQYQFKVNKAAMRLQYRAVNEEMFGQFDYFNIGGPHCATVEFVINALKTDYLETQARGTFDAVMSVKFADFCDQYTFAFELNKSLELVGYKLSGQPAVSIPLEVGHTHMWL